MLQVNKSYRVKKFDSNGCKHYRHKLAVMGMLPGAIFSVVRFAPLGDTVQIEINGFSLGLRKKELRCLQFEEYREVMYEDQ